MQVNDNLGEAMKAARNNKGITQEKLAEILGKGPRHIMALENEGTHPSYELLCRIIRVLDIPADHIFRPETVTRTMEQEQFVYEFLSCDERKQRIVMEPCGALSGD